MEFIAYKYWSDPIPGRTNTPFLMLKEYIHILRNIGVTPLHIHSFQGYT